MKKSILTIVTVAAVLASCTNNGKKVEARQVEEVSINKNEKTASYDQIATESRVDWRASHLGGAQKRFGQVKLKNGVFLVNNKELTNVKVVMDMSSFNVESFPEGDGNNAKLTGHLQSADFFDIAKYPEATFEMTKIEEISGEYSSLLTGNLQIMEVSKSISFKANVVVDEKHVSIKSEDFAVNRTDWNLSYNTEGTEGVPVDYLIANDIGFTIDVALNK